MSGCAAPSIHWTWIKGAKGSGLRAPRVLEIKSLRSWYGPSQALFGVDLQIRPGQVVTLLGRNGMGKSTIVRSIMGLVQCSADCLEFNGRSLLELPAFRVARLGIGLVPEGRLVFPNLSVEEHLQVAANKRPGRAWRTGAIYELFPRLKERRQHMGNQLSGGEQQMLAIGRALSIEPKLLILDEATEGLAPLIRQDIWNAIEQLRKTGLSILLIDKNLNDLLRIGEQHFIINRGRIVWSGNSPELQDNEELKQRYLGL